MNKFYLVVTAVISVASTALAIGWSNDLDYWRRIHTINGEITRAPASKESVPTEATFQHTASATPAAADKPTDRQTIEAWLGEARAARLRDPLWTPPVYSKLGDLKKAQVCSVEFTVLQIDDADARIVLHRGERLWLTGHIPGLVADKLYSCKALFAPAGTYQFNTATDGTRTLAAFRYLGEIPEIAGTKK